VLHGLYEYLGLRLLARAELAAGALTELR
jgi:hypothetical protein